MIKPVQLAVSQATLLIGSCAMHASRTASDTASQTLSGCPSVTDSEVKIYFSICLSFPETVETNKKHRHTAGVLIGINTLIVRSAFRLSLRLAPFVNDEVAVASQVLCTSTTLNKRIYSIFSFPDPVESYSLTASMSMGKFTTLLIFCPAGSFDPVFIERGNDRLFISHDPQIRYPEGEKAQDIKRDKAE